MRRSRESSFKLSFLRRATGGLIVYRHHGDAGTRKGAGGGERRDRSRLPPAVSTCLVCQLSAAICSHCFFSSPPREGQRFAEDRTLRGPVPEIPIYCGSIGSRGSQGTGGISNVDIECKAEIVHPVVVARRAVLNYW